jgi:hypothetical protein
MLTVDLRETSVFVATEKLVEENHFVFSQGNDSHSSVDAVKLK